MISIEQSLNTVTEFPSEMEFRLSRMNAHLPLVLPIAVPMAMILIGELFFFIGNLDACVIVHLLNILICVMAPIFLRENPLLWQSFSLVSILRVMNLGMPRFATLTLYWMPLVYAPVILVAFYMIRDESRGLKDYFRDLKAFFTVSPKKYGWKIYYLPIGIALALLLANIEFKVLSLTISDLRMIPDLSFLNLGLLFGVMVFFVGLGEEFVFRYILQTRLEGAVGVISAILISSVAFAAMHSGYHSIPYLLYVFCVALVLGVLFYRTKSLAVVALIHGTLNFFLFSFLPFGHLVLF
jgi:uncharacterized protein